MVQKKKEEKNSTKLIIIIGNFVLFFFFIFFFFCSKSGQINDIEIGLVFHLILINIAHNNDEDCLSFCLLLLSSSLLPPNL